MFKTHFFFIALLSMSVVVAGQSPYRLQAGRESALGGVGLGLSVTSKFLLSDPVPFTASQLAGLDRNELKGASYWAAGRWSPPTSRASDVLLYTSQALPVVLVLVDKNMRSDAFSLAVMYGEVTLLNYGLTEFTKKTVRRTRPFAWNPAVPIEEKMKPDARESFYSGHTSQTAAMCFFAASLYAEYRPDSRWKPVVWAAAATLPAVTGFLRMNAGKHFPTDLLTGYVTGAAIGYFVPRLHRNPKR